MTEITLKVGQHSLQLLLGDRPLMPQDSPIVSDSISDAVQ
ncbi:MAG: DUF4399 domain-containing protein [Gammaproteobacteria bacterium]|nr:DUF4399 domain-containing protein [Gammaproteobacteria bacterium]